MNDDVNRANMDPVTEAAAFITVFSFKVIRLNEQELKVWREFLSFPACLRTNERQVNKDQCDWSAQSSSVTWQEANKHTSVWSSFGWYDWQLTTSSTTDWSSRRAGLS